MAEETQHAELPTPYTLQESEPQPPAIPEEPVAAVANQLGDVAVESVRLVELQFRLFEVEFRQSIYQMTLPLAVLAGTALVILASVILFLLGLGTGLHDLTALPLSISQLIVAVLGLVAAGAAGWYAVHLLKEPRISFTKSKEEFMRNVEFFGRMMKAK